MLAEEGGLACSFNQTVSVDTLDQVKDAMAWAQQYPDIVHTIPQRIVSQGDLTWQYQLNCSDVGRSELLRMLA